MRDYYADAKSLREQAAQLPDENPVKLCVLTLACVAECYAAAQTFQTQADALPDGMPREFQRGASEAAKVAGDRLLISSAAPIRALLEVRADQNAHLLRFMNALTLNFGKN